MEGLIPGNKSCILVLKDKTKSNLNCLHSFLQLSMILGLLVEACFCILEIFVVPFYFSGQIVCVFSHHGLKHNL